MNTDGIVPDEAEETPTGISRRRGHQLEDAILEAAWDILIEHGYNGLTYEAVAVRAGTSRSVLYRRWPQRDDLLFAAVTRSWRSEPISIPNTDSLREDAIALLHNLNARLPRMIALISAQIMDYFRDSGSNFSKLREALYAPGEPTAFETIVCRAVERGELTDVPRSQRVVNLPFDLFRHDAFMTLREASSESITEIVDEVWLPLLLATAGDRLSSAAIRRQ